MKKPHSLQRLADQIIFSYKWAKYQNTDAPLLDDDIPMFAWFLSHAHLSDTLTQLVVDTAGLEWRELPMGGFQLIRVKGN